ncbi:hypothetical protein ACFVUS_40730 [Nocardia sp. NPDC058058]|uniref:hypothetical protein n=1 Tax=Nocardia sp. NPDC058058 TaxID=3346317 RepID=UPI0036DA3C1D
MARPTRIQNFTADSAFWRSATVTLPLAIAGEAALFAAVVAAITDSDPKADPSRHLLFSIGAAIAVLAVTLLWRRRTPTAQGAALGVATAGAFLLLLWAATL